MMKNFSMYDNNMTEYDQEAPMEDPNIKYKLHIIVPIIWSLIIIFGIIGNGLIIYIILKRRLYKNSCTNCYIINVSIADLCFTLVCVPVTMTAYIYKGWIFGDFMCHFQNLLMFSSVQAACLTLTAMTVDRYLAVLYPFKSIEYRTTKIAFITNIIIWIASFTLNIPYYLYYNQEDIGQSQSNIKYCVATFPSKEMEIVLTLYTVMISYILPLLTIIFCYMRMIIKIYSKSSDQKLVEQSKNFSSSTNYSSNLQVNQNSMNYTGSVNIVKLDNNYNKNSFESLNSMNKYKTQSLKCASYLKSIPNNNLSNNRKSFLKNSLDQEESNNFYQDDINDDNDVSIMRKNEKANRSKTNVPETTLIINKSNNKEIYRFKPSEYNNKVKYNSKNDKLGLNRSYSAYSKPLNFQKCNSVKNPSNLASSQLTIKKQKFKILLLIATVSITFALTWLPAHVIQIWKVAFRPFFPYNDVMYIIKVISHTLTYSNSLLNPFIYVFIGAKFRSHIHSEFNDLYQICCLRKKKVNLKNNNTGMATTTYVAILNKNQVKYDFITKKENFGLNKSNGNRITSINMNHHESQKANLTTRGL